MLSSSAVRTLKRVFLNVAAPDREEKFTSVSREAIHSAGIPERFLLERGWIARGARLHYEGSKENAQQAVVELCRPVGEVKRENRIVREDVSEDQVAEIATRLAREEDKGLWMFPCVFRFTVDECKKMFFEKDDLTVGKLMTALERVASGNVIKLKGMLSLTEDGFLYKREK